VIRSPAWARTFFVVVLATYGALPGTAWAHPQIERGRHQYEDANFRQALQTLQRALRAHELTRDDLVRLFETRALIRLAMNDRAEYLADLGALASIDPEHAFGREVPPDVTTDFARVRAAQGGPLRVAVTTAPAEGGVEIGARVENDGSHLVERLELSGRPTGGADWRNGTDGHLTLAVAPGDRLEYAAVARGPGDAVLASAGTREAPLTFQVPRPTRVPAVVDEHDPDPLDPDDGDDDRDSGDGGGGGPSPWIWVSAGAVGVAVAVVLVVVATSGTDDTQPSVPVVPGY